MDLNFNFLNLALKKYKYIVLFVVVIMVLIISVKFFFGNTNDKATSALEKFYKSGDKKNIIRNVDEFSKISSEIVKLHYVNPLKLDLVFPKGVIRNTKDSLGTIKVRLEQIVPMIAQDSSLKIKWENLFNEINRYKTQLDQDLFESINDVFMYFTQSTISDKVKAERSGIFIEKVIFNKEFIGRWLTLTNVLSAKINRRKKFFD